MSTKRLYLVMVGCTSLLFLLIVAGTFGGNFLLKQRANKLEAAKLENRLLEEQQTALIKANKDIEKYADLEKIANAIVPQDKDQAKTVRELVKIAEESGIPIASITFPSSNLGQATAAPAATSTGGSTTTAATPKPATNVTQVKPVDGMPGVYQLEITLSVSKAVPYTSLITFLQKLEQNRRTAQVSGITIQPDQKNPAYVGFTLMTNVFIKP